MDGKTPVTIRGRKVIPTVIQIPELGVYGLQAWVLTAVGAAMGITKIAFWAKGGQKSSNNNGKLMLAKDTGGFEKEMVLLTKRVIDMNKEIQDQRVADREQWSPGLASLVEANARTLVLLDKHTKALDLYSKYSQDMWIDMAGSFKRLVDKVSILPCVFDGGKVLDKDHD